MGTTKNESLIITALSRDFHIKRCKKETMYKPQISMMSFFKNIALLILFMGMIEITLFAFSCHASPTEEQYLNATNAYRTLQKNSELQRYRHNWLNCIRKFKAVYTENPNHALASSGMYHAAELYLGLHKISGIKKDKDDAIDLLNRVIKRYPSSTDRDMAEKLISVIQSKKTETKIKTAFENNNNNKAKQNRDSSQNISPKLDVQNLSSQEDNAFSQEESNSKAIPQKKSLTKKEYHQKVFPDQTKNTPNKPATVSQNEALEKTGSDQKERTLQKSAPEEKKLTSQKTEQVEQVKKSESNHSKTYPNSNENNAITNANDITNGNAYITDLRSWTTPDYTRIVINVSDERKYVYQFLDENPSMKKPQRLYLNIKKSLLGENLPSHTRINDDLLIQARAGQHTSDSVRVVVDIKSFDSYKVFSLKDPFRIIIDVWGEKSSKRIETIAGSEAETKAYSETAKTKIADSKASQPDVAGTDTSLTLISAPKSAADQRGVEGDAQRTGTDQDVPASEIASDTSSNLAMKRSVKRSTRTSTTEPSSEISSTESYPSVTDTSSELTSKEATSHVAESEVNSAISSKASTKTATRSSYAQSTSTQQNSLKQNISSEESAEIDPETNSKEAAHLPVKRSTKASTIIISEATRELLRASLKKEPKEVDSRITSKSAYSKNSEEVLDSTDSKSSKESSGKATKGTTRVVQIAPGSNVDKIKASSIAKQLALGVRTVVIDPGHGGKDPGASGYTKGVYEKDIVLAMSRRLASKIRSRLNCNVILTRSGDSFLTLEERTAIANTKGADLFISLHCNASNDKSLVGIETYYLNLATDERSINVAARENATSKKNISDLEGILNDLMKNAKINESKRLSTVVQDHIYQGMKKKYSGIKNLGVKQAPFYVLLGASMPSILIETSFLSNPQEGRRLTDAAYQNALCDAITDGIAKYISETNPQRL
ncbi:MAG: N-acetylmuramoyl-L-alanine amidase [Desulfamplus sp.]|nr:N-acetylmuramoyl-L-alanine amidase [Desulfamplus sp.]